eukprot:3731231-Pyramimonas_sp.AAC.2
MTPRRSSRKPRRAGKAKAGTWSTKLSDEPAVEAAAADEPGAAAAAEPEATAAQPEAAAVEPEKPKTKALYAELAEFADAENTFKQGCKLPVDHAASSSERVQISNLMLPKDALPKKELNPGQKNYRVPIEDGGKIEVQLHHRLFRVIECVDGVELGDTTPNYTRLAYGSVAECWKAAVGRAQGTSSC